MSKAWHGRAGIELHRLGITFSDALQIPHSDKCLDQGWLKKSKIRQRLM